MTKQEAEEELKLLIKKQTEKFCPLARMTCTEHCQCFESGVSQDSLKDYKAYTYCSNEMFEAN